MNVPFSRMARLMQHHTGGGFKAQQLMVLTRDPENIRGYSGFAGTIPGLSYKVPPSSAALVGKTTTEWKRKKKKERPAKNLACI